MSNIYKELGEKQFLEERKERWFNNSEILSKKYGMTENIFKNLISAGQNPKSFLGANVLVIGDQVIV